MRVRVYEIEHDGDLDEARSCIKPAGGIWVADESVDYERDESAVFIVELPTGTDLRDFRQRMGEAGACM